MFAESLNKSTESLAAALARGVTAEQCASVLKVQLAKQLDRSALIEARKASPDVDFNSLNLTLQGLVLKSIEAEVDAQLADCCDSASAKTAIGAALEVAAVAVSKAIDELESALDNVEA